MNLRHLLFAMVGVILLATPLQSNAQDSFKTVATISATLGNESGRLCVGAPISGSIRGALGCPSSAPQIVGGGISASGIITATFFEGDGSRLTGVGGGTGDRISSGTLAMVANSDTSIVSLSTAETTWGYLGNLMSYLPQINTARVSSSLISSTYVQLSSATDVLSCTSARSGTLRYTSGSIQVCNGSSWSGNHSGAVDWSSYQTIPARGTPYVASTAGLVMHSATVTGYGTCTVTVTVGGTVRATDMGHSSQPNVAAVVAPVKTGDTYQVNNDANCSSYLSYFVPLVGDGGGSSSTL